jgi:hypothetical protein
LRPDASCGMVMGRIFLARSNRTFFSPARTRPGPARKMLRSNSPPFWFAVSVLHWKNK